MKKRLTLALLFLGLTATTAQATEPLAVVTSFSVLADIAQNVGGNTITVTSLVGPNGDPHAYQPTPEDAKTLSRADIMIVNGLGFEGWMDRLIEASGFKGTVVVATRGIEPRTLDEDGHNIPDPHAWQDLSRGRIYAQNIAAALEAKRPEAAAKIKRQAKAYDSALAKEDARIRKQFAAIPAARRKAITNHDAFGYFGEAYGVTFLAPAGLSTAAEPSAANVAHLIQQIRNEKIRYVFIENITNPKLIEQIGRDAGAKMGGTLYTGALSLPDGEAPSYLAMIKQNVEKLTKAMKN